MGHKLKKFDVGDTVETHWIWRQLDDSNLRNYRAFVYEITTGVNHYLYPISQFFAYTEELKTCRMVLTEKIKIWKKSLI